MNEVERLTVRGFSDTPVRLLYIMGASRSGSTVLDIVLGNHPAIEAVGELRNFLRSWTTGEYCACGQRSPQCAFWSAVRSEWTARIGREQVQNYPALQDRFESLRSIRVWWRLLDVRRQASPEFAAYADQTRALFEAIRTVSGKSLIVDSSKYPMRAFALSLIPGLDLRLIHLIRNGQGVAWSLKKTYKRDDKSGVPRDMLSRPVWRTAIFWVLVNLQSSWVARQYDKQRFTRLRYEDFVANPQAILAEVGKVGAVDLTAVAEEVATGAAMKINHTIAGNRARMTGSVQLRLDTEWMEKMPRRDQRLVRMLTGWLMRRYGYEQEDGRGCR